MNQQPVGGFEVAEVTSRLAAEAAVVAAAAFPDFNPAGRVCGETCDVLVALDFEAFVTDTRSVFVPDYDGDTMVGFSLAIPLSMMNPSRGEEEPGTAYVYYTAFQPDFQGQGRVWPLQEEMFRQLVDRGYTAVERDIMLDAAGGHYAEAYARRFGYCTETVEDHDRWGLGMQRRFRTDLQKFLSENPA